MNAKKIAQLVGGSVVGDETITIKGCANIQEATAEHITFLANTKYMSLFTSTNASIILVPKDSDIESDKTLILTNDPSYSFSLVMEALYPNLQKHPEKLHPQAVIDQSASLGNNVAVGACVIIEAGAVIGDNTIIYAGSYIGHDTKIGNNSIIYPNVTVRERCLIGDRVIIHSGTVIGADGFGFVTINGIHKKIPQLGTVVIEDDVEIGSNVSIDRARFDKTVIKKGAMVDNLVQIAHNVIIGENSIIVSQVGISGSTKIGRNVVLAGKVGVVGHIEISDNVMVGAKGGVSKSITQPGKYWGVPAKPLQQDLKEKAAVQKLPDLQKKIRALEKEIINLKNQLTEKN